MTNTTENTKPAYEAPCLKVEGSLKDLTLGTAPNASSDSAFTCHPIMS